MRRIATIALTSLSLLLGLSAAGRLLAQDDAKKEEVKKDETAKKDEPKKDEPKKEEPKAEATKLPSAGDLPAIPKEVEEKLEAARKAVAEAIVAAQDAGLVKTTIDPPPILDILITGRASDETALKAATSQNPEAGVSPEVFGAWFTGFGKLEGVTAEKNVRITPPSKGLIDYFTQRKNVMTRHLADARKAKGEAKPEEKKDEPKPEAKAEEKKDEPKPEAKPEEKKDEPKPETKPEEKKDEPKADAKPEEKKDEPKAEEAPK